MIDYFRCHLGAKLLLSYLSIIVVGMIVLVLGSQSILPTSFNRHMSGMGMGFAPGTGVSAGIPGMMGGQGVGGPAGMMQLYVDYRAGFNEVLTYAGLAAAAASLALSLFFSRSVVAPVRAMSRAAERIAAGRYDERVQAGGADELAQLAGRFNQMAERLDQVESLRRQLIGDVSHELRTPLTAIKGSMEGLMDGVLPASSETYQQIHAEADRLNRLVDDLQELSRVEARAFQLDIQPVDVQALAGTVVKRLAIQAVSKHVSIELELAADLPRVMADEDRAAQVLINLVGNALQYSPEGSRVTIGASQVGKEVQIRVRDAGIGIASEHLPYLFDRFYRVDRSRSRQSGGGSGIGLTIARAIVEAHGGRIWVESGGAGRGSMFSFTLPAAE